MKRSTFDELIEWDTKEDKPDDAAEFSQRLADYKDTFSTPHGRRTLLNIIENTFQHESPFTGSSQTYYNIALVDWGRALLDVIAIADPETFLHVYAQRSNDVRDRYLDKVINEDERK